MRKFRLALAVALILFAMNFALNAIPLPAQETRQVQSFRTFLGAPQATLSTVPFESQLMHTKVPFNIILPVGYDAGARRYPVLLLLHGLWGHYNDWADCTNIVLYASHYPLIIVMPEGGNGWYTNGTAPDAKWEDYIIKELMPYVDAHYRTLGQHPWAVAGLSMGGYGAVKFGLKYREKFNFAASMSGALEITQAKDADLGKPDGTVFTSVHAAFGPEGSAARKENDLAVLLDAPGPPLPYLYVDCGTEDHLYPQARHFADLLQSKKIPHDYRERPGIHNWEEWDHQIQGVLQLLAERWSLSWCQSGTICDGPMVGHFGPMPMPPPLAPVIAPAPPAQP